MKKKATNWEKILRKHISDKGLVSKIYEEPLKLNSKKTNNTIKKWTKDLNRHLTKEGIQMANKYMKSYTISFIIRECKLTQDTTAYLFEWLNSKKLTISNAVRM